MKIRNVTRVVLILEIDNLMSIRSFLFVFQLESEMQEMRDLYEKASENFQDQ